MASRLSVWVSGSGSNLERIVEASRNGEIPASVVLVVSDRPGILALERAAKHSIPSAVISKKDYESEGAYALALMELLKKHRVDLICLAGYLRKVPNEVVRAYSGRILNLHPALLPNYGGKGFFGRTVHEAVLAAKEKETGATVHYVDEQYDHGSIILQKKIPVLPTDTPETLAERVHQLEYEIYPEAIKLVLQKLARR
ncbi:MAG TPA: phosphoribosylglycinamide formyltransferase [Verrucomicrobiae bacterium]|nr:phosphoribosylglycinamide formyltransferase [Verrucomicrobiae bacterium]